MRRVPTYYQDLVDIIGLNPGHVVGSSACLGGALPTQILRGADPNVLNDWIQQMIGIFGKENFYLEMQPSKNKEQIQVNRALANYSKENDIGLIITTDSHYLKKEDRPIHKSFLNAQDGEREVDEFYATTYMMDTEELESYMAYSFDSEEILKNSYNNIEKIANMCEDFSLIKPLKIPELIWRDLDKVERNYKDAFSKMPTLEKFYNSEYRSDRYLVDAVIDGIIHHEDLQNEEAYAALEDNLQRTWESSEVNQARWSAYYLNLQKNIDECWNAGTIVGPARGSGGGFVLLYCLDVIQMNCLREPTPMFAWRFLNPQRVSVLDIDTDIEGGRRAQVLQHLRSVYGDDRVANVSTFRTEKSKSAILTAARGLGIDIDKAQYITSLIPADRGQLRSLKQCMYGDEEKGWGPIKQFVIEMSENYPELWRVASGIEGLICGSGIHAGGIIFVDEPFTESTSLMRAPDGTICTAFDLHDCENCSLIKIDLLSVEAMDKIHNCIDLLCENGYAERKETLRETYESIIGIYKIERDAPEMWKMVHEHKICSLFQMEEQSGINGISVAKPKSIDELAVLNSVIRLMASEKGAEQPLDMWARYRKNIQSWYSEMRQYGLKEEQINWLANHSAIHDGICESQEGLMSLVQEPRLGGNSLTFADKCRKAIAKKEGKLFEECENFYFKNAEEKGCDMTLVHYVWDVVFKCQRGYSFNASHTHAYSLVALQEMNLCYKYPIIFWNTACLINDAGGNDTDESEEILKADENKENEDEQKKKNKVINYGKVASAIGRMSKAGIKVSPPDINLSSYTFKPLAKENRIIYGLKGITRVGADVIDEIMINRPYEGVDDFISKVKINKTQMINLIKSGAFDSFGDRVEIMRKYIYSIADTKKRLTLQNCQMLINYNLIPIEYDFQIRVFNYNKYLKKLKNDIYFNLDNIAIQFYQSYFDMDLLESGNSESGFVIKQTSWKKIYDGEMAKIRTYIKNNNQELLTTMNNMIVQDIWKKYCLGSLSKWEMDSVSFYSHPHELANVDNSLYNFANFFSLPTQPAVDHFIPIKGQRVPLYKIERLAGTVLDKNKNKNSVTLLTTDGVVTVKIFGPIFANYDKQISEKQADGTKKVIEKSWFTRGNKIIVCGVRRDDQFLAKKYKNTPYHLVELITDIHEDGSLAVQGERYS